MPDISGSIGSTFVVTLDSGTILLANLHLPGAGLADTPLPHTDQTITVNPPGGLPMGPSVIRLAIDFAPGEPNANIGLGNVMNGQAAASDPPGVIIDDGRHSAGSITMRGA
jgi:hypothetical protein